MLRNIDDLEYKGKKFDRIWQYIDAKYSDITRPLLIDYRRDFLAKIDEMVGTKKEIQAAEAEAEKQAREAYLASREESRKLERAVDEEFRQLLAKEYGTEGNPKEKLLFEKAEQRESGCGCYDIENAYQDLADLIK